MSKHPYTAPKGTRDILTPESTRRRRLVNVFADLVERNGFGLIESPVFEDIDVYLRLGTTTDIYSKELFSFQDKSDTPKTFALRPELTAGICRAFVQHKPRIPWKVWYEGANFRYERPQAGRYRQFNQIGVECIGTRDPHADVEVIALAVRFFESVGLQNVRLLINSVGDEVSRPAYQHALSAYFHQRANELTEQSRITLKTNPLRLLDSKRSEEQHVIDEAPVMSDFLSKEAVNHFQTVQNGLQSLDVCYEIAPRLVRGLDYYTLTIFEFISESLTFAQNAVGGGGRYNNLVQDLGGPKTPGIGLALGVDRIMLACEAENVFESETNNSALRVFVIDITGGEEAVMLCDMLSSAGAYVERAFDGRSMKAQMKLANRSGAHMAVIVGPEEKAQNEVTVRYMRVDDMHCNLREYFGGERQRCMSKSELMKLVAENLTVSP